MSRIATVRRIALLSAGLLLVIPRSTQAQAPATTLEDLAQRVRSGSTVTVTDDTGRKVTGKLAQLTPEQLVLLVGDQKRVFTGQTITEVRQRERDSIVNGLVIGGAIGTAPLIFLAVTDFCSDGCDDGWVFRLGMLSIGSGMAAGAGLDASIAKRTVIYRRAGLALHLRPIARHGATGVGLSIRF